MTSARLARVDWREQVSKVRIRLRLGHSAPPPDPRIEALAKHWEMLAAEDPLWAILADPSKRGGRWELEEFLATGEREIDAVLGYVAGLPVEPGRGRALDFGCGIGRLTRALARHFERVDGIDISPTMLEQARRVNADVPNCRFTRETSTRLPFESGTFDFVYSALVLQHMESELALAYVGEFVRTLEPGGLAVFQAPSRHRAGGADRAVTPVELSRGTAEVEMNAHPRQQVEAAVRGAGGKIVDIRPNESAGEAFESLCYAVTR